MKKEIIIQLNKTFEESAYTQKNVEYWMARDLQKLLDYAEWRNFLLVIEKAKTACLNSNQNISYRPKKKISRNWNGRLNRKVKKSQKI